MVVAFAPLAEGVTTRLKEIVQSKRGPSIFQPYRDIWVWDGGLRQLPPGLTYTATGFSNPVRVVFHAVLRPTLVEDSTEAVARHFRTAIRLDREEVPVIDRLVLRPPVRALLGVAALVRRMHVGYVNAYAGYVLLTLLVVLLVGLGVLR